VDNTCPRSDARNGVSVYSDWPDPADTRLNTVRVCVRRQTASLFAQLSGVSGVYVSAQAAARVVDEPSPYSLMAMNMSAGSTLRVHGPAVGIMGGGGTYTRSSHMSRALDVEDCAGSLTSTGVNHVVGGVGCASDVSPAATRAGILEDPFEDLLQPSPTAGCATPPAPSFTGDLVPGTTYCSLTVGSTGNVNLPAGVYHFRGPVIVHGSGTLRGSDVLLYLTCASSPCNGSRASRFEFMPNSNIRLTGRAASRDMLLWVDRTSAPGEPALDPQVLITGSPTTILDGRIYGYTAHVEIGGPGGGGDDADEGGGGGAPLNLNTTIVADNIKFSASNPINLSYNTPRAPAPPLRLRGIVQ
jgi:hypothetical protein